MSASDLRGLQRIRSRAERLIDELPPDVLLVAAAKSRSTAEVEAAIQGGVRCVGHNYVQEAQRMLPGIGSDVSWHLIGHLQRNKAATAVSLFDMVETVDSARLADALERHCDLTGHVMPVLIEVNSGLETTKSGVMPGDLDALAEHVDGLPHLRLEGLMTIGPLFGDPEESRPYFRATREAFERLAARSAPPGRFRYLSMGMSHSYRVAIEEGANVVRVGTLLFGPRTSAARE